MRDINRFENKHNWLWLSLMTWRAWAEAWAHWSRLPEVAACCKLPGAHRSDHMEEVDWSSKEMTRSPSITKSSNHGSATGPLFHSLLVILLVIHTAHLLSSLDRSSWHWRRREILKKQKEGEEVMKAGRRKNPLATEGRELFFSLGGGTQIVHALFPLSIHSTWQAGTGGRCRDSNWVGHSLCPWRALSLQRVNLWSQCTGIKFLRLGRCSGTQIWVFQD